MCLINGGGGYAGRMGASPMQLNLEAWLRITRGVAWGLAFIHEKKDVHGNVKPFNILLGGHGAAGQRPGPTTAPLRQ